MQITQLSIRNFKSIRDLEIRHIENALILVGKNNTGKTGVLKARFRERQALRAEIEQTRHSIDSARNHFEQVVDPTLIDCYIYELNAAQLRYQFLLRSFKNLEAEAR